MAEDKLSAEERYRFNATDLKRDLEVWRGRERDLVDRGVTLPPDVLNRFTMLLETLDYHYSRTQSGDELLTAQYFSYGLDRCEPWDPNNPNMDQIPRVGISEVHGDLANANNIVYRHGGMLNTAHPYPLKGSKREAEASELPPERSPAGWVGMLDKVEPLMTCWPDRTVMVTSLVAPTPANARQAALTLHAREGIEPISGEVADLKRLAQNGNSDVMTIGYGHSYGGPMLLAAAPSFDMLYVDDIPGTGPRPQATKGESTQLDSAAPPSWNSFWRFTRTVSDPRQISSIDRTVVVDLSRPGSISSASRPPMTETHPNWIEVRGITQDDHNMIRRRIDIARREPPTAPFYSRTSAFARRVVAVHGAAAIPETSTHRLLGITSRAAREAFDEAIARPPSAREPAVARASSMAAGIRRVTDVFWLRNPPAKPLFLDTVATALAKLATRRILIPLGRIVDNDGVTPIQQLSGSHHKSALTSSRRRPGIGPR